MIPAALTNILADYTKGFFFNICFTFDYFFFVFSGLT